MFDLPPTVTSKADLKPFVSRICSFDIINHVSNDRPYTKWVVLTQSGL